MGVGAALQGGSGLVLPDERPLSEWSVRSYALREGPQIPGAGRRSRFMLTEGTPRAAAGPGDTRESQSKGALLSFQVRVALSSMAAV